MSQATLLWRVVDQQTLAEHLEPRQITASQTLPGLHLYHCRETGPGGRESLALSLPDGQGLLITLPEPAPSHPKRRQRDQPLPDFATKDTTLQKSG